VEVLGIGNEIVKENSVAFLERKPKVREKGKQGEGKTEK